MIDTSQIDYAALAVAAQHGSPLVTSAAGRLLGMGEAERDALSSGKIPGWVLLVGGLAAGIVIGARIHKHWGTVPWVKTLITG